MTTPDLYPVPGLPGFSADAYGNIWCNGFSRTGAVDTSGNVWIAGQLRAVLVCSAFHGPAPTESATVTHLDGVNGNDVPTNLEWVS